MKKLITILVALLITASTFAQAPDKMSYQAVVRDSDDNLVTNQPVGIKISILQYAVGGSAVYEETQTPTTNANGLVSLEIGTDVTGNFSTIDWSAGPYFIKTETDPAGETNYTITGTSQLMSVPFALYAKTSGSSTPGPQGPAGDTGAAGNTGATGPAGTYTAGSGIDITGSVITATPVTKEFAYITIANTQSSGGVQDFYSTSSDRLNGITITGDSIIHLKANKSYEISANMSIYNSAAENYVYFFKNITQNQTWGGNVMNFGYSGNDRTNTTETIRLFYKPAIDIEIVFLRFSTNTVEPNISGGTITVREM